MSTEPSAPDIGPPASGAKRRRIGLAAAVAMVVAAAAGYYCFFFRLPIGSGPAGPAVSRSAFNAPWTQRPVVLLGLGDSVTAGFGATAGHGYFDRLVTNPSDEFADMQGICLSKVLPNLTSKNLAVSGSTSDEHLLHQVSKIPVGRVETFGLVVITTGGNDLIHNYGRTPPREGAMYGATLSQAQPWIEAFARRLDAMVVAIEASFPGGCLIFLANIYDPTDGVGDIQHAGLPRWREGLAVLAAYNEALRRCAETHPSVHLVAIHRAFLGHGIHCTQFWRQHYHAEDPHYWYYENLEDPNDRGYDAIRRLFLIEMAAQAGHLH